MLKKVIASFISLQIVISLAFVQEFHFIDNEKYGFCNAGCQNQEHFKKFQENKGISQNDKLFSFMHDAVRRLNVNSFRIKPINYVSWESPRSFNLFCRPPPEHSC